MRPSPIESSSLLSALEPPVAAPSRPREPSAPDPRAAQFGQLFARVFGEQTRQPVATSAEPLPPDASSEDSKGRAQGTEVPEGSGDTTDTMGADFRAVHLSGGTQIITAGPPPEDEDLLRFARDAEMDEGSVAALLRGEGSAEAGEVNATDAAAASPLVVLQTAQQALAARWADRGGAPAEGSSPGNGSAAAQGDTSPAEGGESSSAFAARLATASATAGTKANAPPSNDKTDLTAAASRAASEASRPAAAGAAGTAFSVAVSASSQPTAEKTVTGQWMQARATAGATEPTGATDSNETHEATEFGPDGEPIASEKAEALMAQRKAQGRYGFEALRLRLGLEEASAKDRLIKILGPDALRAAQESQPEGTRLEAIRLMEQMPEVALESPAPSSGSTSLGAEGADERSALATATAGSSGQGSGQEGGGSRPDSSNAQGGLQPRSLPQQVLQRFGELLSQRILQQVSQGSWRVELDLEPGDLGSIRIELELRKGEIEASIKASQATTRDLLQESLPRLREALERNGMDVASLSVGQQDRRQSGGQSSSGQSSSERRASASGQSSDASPASGAASASDRDDGRLDVWV